MRAKKSLSAVSATLTRVASPGAMRQIDAAQRERLPVEELATARSVAHHRQRARAGGAIGGGAGGAEVVDGRVAAQREARPGGGARPANVALEARLRLLDVDVEDVVEVGIEQVQRHVLDEQGEPGRSAARRRLKPASSPRASMLPTTPLPTALPVGPAGTETRAETWNGAAVALSTAKPRSSTARSRTSSATAVGAARST